MIKFLKKLWSSIQKKGKLLDMNPVQFPDVVKAVILFQEGHNTYDYEEREVHVRSPSELQGKIRTMEQLGQRFVGFKMLNGQAVPNNPQYQHAAHQYMKNWAQYLNSKRSGRPYVPQQQQVVQQPQQIPQQGDSSGFLPPQTIDPLTGENLQQPQIQQMTTIDVNTGLPIPVQAEKRILSEVVVDGKKVRSWSDGTIEAEEWIELTEEEISSSLRIEPLRDANGKIVKNKYKVSQKKWTKKNG